MIKTKVPQLITFDGEARSGKGTIAHSLKRSLTANGFHPVLIDTGQVFRGLVVAATRKNVDFDDPAAIDSFLADEAELQATVALLKQIYAMTHEERDTILYTKVVSENSAKVARRPLSQEFAFGLVKKWIRDAGNEGGDVILLDGRALEGFASDVADEGLASYVLGLYFVCDPLVGARRTLGFADRPYDALTAGEKAEVDDFTQQIVARNHADMTRPVMRLAQPDGARVITLPEVPELTPDGRRMMVIVDSSAELTKDQMTAPMDAFVMRFVDR